MDPQILIKQLKAGDNKSFEYLYDHYAPTLFGIITRIIPKPEDAENVLQDCFIKIWKYIASYDASKGSLATWLINIARNTAIDFTRSSQYLNSNKNQNLDYFVYNEMPSLSVRISDEEIGLRELVNKLDPSCRQILEWMYFEGYTQQEISDEFSIPLGTVKTRARNGLKALRSLFETEKTF
ncbi:MAG: RNA polymerase sigma factor [Saprospiraceae bacterium]|nr:RNA polymerase sigma factor [Saprospiraceae bacterium]